SSSFVQPSSNFARPPFSLATSHGSPGSMRQTAQGISTMEKKHILITLAVFAFAFGTAPRSKAGTDTIEPYRAPAPTYKYEPPPPRPVAYGPPIGFGVAVGPGFYGPRFGFFRGHRFHRRNVFWRGRPRHWH